MTELEMFAKDFIESGGEFWTLETCTRGKLAKTVSIYEVDGQTYHEVRYQVFNAEGKRVFVHTSYMPALRFYDEMRKEI